jgi:hypothetical protein
MKTMKALMFCAAFALPTAVAQAQSSDTAYCNALAAKYRSTIGNGTQTYAGVPEAIAGCSTKPAASIPTLEKVLNDNKVALPPR